ncbi:MAG: tetratricopeptide repeat protein, partial [Candidatus Solibacter usitatus]|nr:tetratricopeptide repeat protein [Candidatus Solibacter usitatus]
MAEILDGWEWVDPDPLEAFLPKAGETPPPAPAAPLVDWKQAVEWRRQGKTEEALDALRALLAAGGGKIEPHLAMGHIQFELGRFGEAAAAYFQAVELDPEHRTAYYDLALSLSRMGRWQEAASAFQQALDFEATNVYARLGLGNCLLHRSGWRRRWRPST